MVFPVRISGPFCGGSVVSWKWELFATHGVKSNGKGAALLSLLGLTGVVDDGLVVLIRAVREVHADNVETSYGLSASHYDSLADRVSHTSAERVDLLGRVGLGT